MSPASVARIEGNGSNAQNSESLDPWNDPDKNGSAFANAEIRSPPKTLDATSQSIARVP